MNIVLSHSGKQHSYHVAKAMKQLSVLELFYTSSYVKHKSIQDYFTRQGNTYWTRRFIEGVSGIDVDANWRYEAKEVLLRRFLGKSPQVQQAVYNRDVKFDQYVAKRLSRHKNTDVFWGFQGSCHITLQKANDLGLLSVCELATAHVEEAKRLLGEEAKLLPEWADSIDNLVFEPVYEKRLQEEPHLAQKVIAASLFTKQSLLNSDIPEEKIEVLPLGFDMDHIPYTERTIPKANKPFRLLYSGTVTQRKGIAYLLEAMKTFDKKDVELHIVGGIQGSGEAFDKMKDRCVYHPPVSQHEMFAMYQDFDALVLPTIFEGFGLVIVEAMAAGLPVITTKHSMGPDVISEDKNGYIVPIRSSQSIEEAICKLVEKTPETYLEMRKAARNAAMKFTWQRYQENLATLLKQFEL